MGTSIGNSVTEQFEAKLIRIRTLSKTTRDFRFRRLDGSGIQFEPGEFFRFSFSDDQGKFERPYSLCDFTDGADDELDLLISVVDNGRASRYLFNCEEGINTRVTGPYGRLLIPRILPMRLFLVATSVGLAPFLPMLNPLGKHMVDSGLEVILLLGARDRSEFLYRDELLAFSDKYPGFSLVLCYSREGGDLLPYERHSYVTEQINSFKPDAGTDHFLLCGNPYMINDVYGLLKQNGFKAKQVVREKYVFARQEKPSGKVSLTAAQKQLIAEKLRKYR